MVYIVSPYLDEPEEPDEVPSFGGMNEYTPLIMELLSPPARVDSSRATSMRSSPPASVNVMLLKLSVISMPLPSVILMAVET